MNKDNPLQYFDISKDDRSKLKNQKPCVIWLTGISGAGKSTLANALDQKLYALGKHTYILDGDNVRNGLCKDLGFTDEDRSENIRRVAEVASLMVDAGLIVITAFISPFKEDRRAARLLLEDKEFIEVFIDTPLKVAEERDVKGLYKKAKNGNIDNFTGIDSIYESPLSPHLKISHKDSVEIAVDKIIAIL